MPPKITLGPAFSAALDGLETGRWSGPVDSAYGHHLVLVTERLEGSLPSYEELHPVLLRDYESERRRLANEKLYESLWARYEIVVAVAPQSSQVAAVAGKVEERP